MSLSTSIIGEPARPEGGHEMLSLVWLGIDTPPPCQVAVAVVKDGLVNSRKPDI